MSVVGPDLRGIMRRLAKARVEHDRCKSDPQQNVTTGQELYEATKLFDMALASWYSALEKEEGRAAERVFPILREGDAAAAAAPHHVPWDFVEPGRARAQENHTQTLERLAERGGLSPGELRCALENRKLFDEKWTPERAQRDAQWLIEALAKWMSAKGTP